MRAEDLAQQWRLLARLWIVSSAPGWGIGGDKIARRLVKENDYKMRPTAWGRFLNSTFWIKERTELINETNTEVNGKNCFSILCVL